MKKAFVLIGLVFGCILLLSTESWSYYSYRCEILELVSQPDGAIITVAPAPTETGFSENSRVYVSNEPASRVMFEMVLSAASRNMEIIVSTTGRISWAPQIVQSLTIIASDSETSEQRSPDFQGPIFLKSYSVDNTGSYYYVSDPNNLPENAIAVRVPTFKPTLASFMTTAFMNGKSVLVAVSNRWWLGQGQLAWTIYAAKME
jgi:hypothetical protein